MTKYRIIEKRYVLYYGYLNESSGIPKEIQYSEPIILVQRRKSIFHKWRKIKTCNTIKEAEFYVYNKKLEDIEPITQVIKKL